MLFTTVGPQDQFAFLANKLEHKLLFSHAVTDLQEIGAVDGEAGECLCVDNFQLLDPVHYLILLAYSSNCREICFSAEAVKEV